MNTLTIEGIVPDSFKDQKEFYLHICPEFREKSEKFFSKIDTVLRSDRIAVRRAEYVNKCKAGDRVRYTLAIDHRRKKIGVTGVGCEII